MGKDGFGRYPVSDAKQLQELVARVVKHYGHGSLNRAANTIGISQPTLYRLHEGMSGNVSQATMARLEAAILEMDKRLQRQLLLAVMSTAALRLYRRGFSEWCRERALRLVRRRGQTWGRERGKAPRPIRQQWQRNALSVDLRSTLDKAYKEFPRIFERFHRFAIRKGVPEERYKVSIVRIVEPLAEASASAFFEPRWIDLTSAQRRQFLEAGRKREELLLSRPHQQVQANLLARGEDPAGTMLLAKLLAGAPGAWE